MKLYVLSKKHSPYLRWYCSLHLWSRFAEETSGEQSLCELRNQQRNLTDELLNCLLSGLSVQTGFFCELSKRRDMHTLSDNGASWLTIANVLLHVSNLDLDPARMQLAFQSEQLSLLSAFTQTWRLDNQVHLQI